MLDSLIDFYKSEPVNHWSSNLVGFFIIALLIYILFFYFSKSGRDERGKTIFARASLITFSVIVIWIHALAGPLLPLVVSSAYATAIFLMYTLLLLMLVQALGLFIINKLI